MTTVGVLAVLVLLGAFVGGALLVLRRHAQRPGARDDTLRAGAPSEALSPQQAALRAGGRNAWMRPGGF